MTSEEYKILVLTDHSRHSRENSVYALIEELKKSDRCDYIDVITRGSGWNYPFFQQLDDSQMKAVRVNREFKFDPSGKQYYTNLRRVALSDYDIILLRLPRPTSDHFLLWLEEKTINKAIINRPKGIIVTSSKSFLLRFPDLCPPMKLCHSVQEILSFAGNFPIVIKPLREYGGKGILKLEEDRLHDGENYADPVEYLQKLKPKIEEEGYLAMKFMKNVHLGDKRILVVGGDIMAATLRVPPENSWLCNVARGGKSFMSELESEEETMIKKIDPVLQNEGVLIYGVDTLVNDEGKRVLSEINTLSTGGIMQADEQTGKPILKNTALKIFEYADKTYGRSPARP